MLMMVSFICSRYLHGAQRYRRAVFSSGLLETECIDAPGGLTLMHAILTYGIIQDGFPLRRWLICKTDVFLV